MKLQESTLASYVLPGALALCSMGLSNFRAEASSNGAPSPEGQKVSRTLENTPDQEIKFPEKLDWIAKDVPIRIEHALAKQGHPLRNGPIEWHDWYEYAEKAYKEAGLGNERQGDIRLTEDLFRDALEVRFSLEDVHGLSRGWVVLADSELEGLVAVDNEAMKKFLRDGIAHFKEHYRGKEVFLDEVFEATRQYSEDKVDSYLPPELQEGRRWASHAALHLNNHLRSELDISYKDRLTVEDVNELLKQIPVPPLEDSPTS